MAISTGSIVPPISVADIQSRGNSKNAPTQRLPLDSELAVVVT